MSCVHSARANGDRRNEVSLSLRFDGCRMFLLQSSSSFSSSSFYSSPRPSTRLQPVFDGGVGGGKRVAFQNSFRVRQRLESSVASVIAWENSTRSLSLYFNVRQTSEKTPLLSPARKSEKSRKKLPNRQSNFPRKTPNVAFI